jgi:hypothetical protein
MSKLASLREERRTKRLQVASSKLSNILSQRKPISVRIFKDHLDASVECS